jgi:uncharacterized protein YaaQ
MGTTIVDRIMFLVVAGSHSNTLLKNLTRDNFNFTIIDSTSGIVQEPMVCLMVGFAQERLPVLLDLVRKDCHSYKQFIPAQGLLQGEFSALPMVEAQMGGALIYLMNVERFEQF